MSQGTKGRSVATGVALLLWMAVNWLLNVTAPLIANDLAVKQFENSDGAYVVSQGARFFNGSGMPIVLLIIVLVAIWWKPLKSLVAGAFIIVLMMGAAHSAHAYYQQTDYTETYFVLPNQSAFYTPDVGDNKTSQAKFGSEEYLAENKIAAKRFNIPHVKLQGSGVFANYYVPAGRLIIVDRATYSRHWVDSDERGTSTRDQSIHCQSKDGLDIKVGIAIGVSVHEDQSPKYLFNFGIVPPEGDPTTPEVIFTSVFHARSLADVMDTFGFTETQAAICTETTKRTFEQVNAEAGAIIEKVEANVKTRFAEMGITISYFGWGDTFHFDPAVQKAINDRYAAQILAEYIPTLQALADMQVKVGLAAGLSRKLPNTLLLPPDVMSNFVGTSLLKPMGPVTK